MLQDITRPISTINKLCHNYFTYYTLTMFPIWLQKFSNSKLYQSKKLPNKVTLSRKYPIIASFMTDKKAPHFWRALV